MKSAVAWLTALVILGCARAPASPAEQPPRASPTPVAASELPNEKIVGSAPPPGTGNQNTSPAPTRVPAASATSAPRGTVTLAVPGFDPALVSLPPSAPLPQPVVIVAHGAKDLPAAQCRFWRAILGDRAVLVCLSGPLADVKAEPRYFPDHLVLEEILVATLAALRAAYPAVVDPTGALYAGYSQGATMGSLMIGAHAADFPRLALVEGGFEQWTVPGALAFKNAGGRRVLFACGTRRCLEHATTSARFLRTAGVEARVVSNLAQGHAYGPGLLELVRSGVDWLVADDPRFAVGGQ